MLKNNIVQEQSPENEKHFYERVKNNLDKELLLLKEHLA